MTKRKSPDKIDIKITSFDCVADASMIKLKALAKTKKVLKTVSVCGEIKEKWMVKLSVNLPNGTTAVKWADITTGTLFDAKTGRTASRQLYLTDIPPNEGESL